MKDKIAVIVLISSALFSTKTFASETREYITSCSTGNFIGSIKYNIKTDSNKITTTMTHYKIQRINGQKGGNKGNINVTGSRTTGVRNATGGTNWVVSGGKTYRSPDNRNQNGNWHQFGHTGYVWEGPIPTGAYIKRANLDIEFVFDKAGSDPKCNKYVTHEL